MIVRRAAGLTSMIASLALVGSASAGEPSPEPDEKCIERCDEQADKCMQEAAGDPDRMQACDDKYSECLAACPAG